MSTEASARDMNLISRICNNDTAALTELVHAHGQRLVDVALGIVLSPDLAEEVVQDVFKRVWDTRAQLDIRGSVIGYLIRATRNAAFNLHIHEQAVHKAESRSVATLDASETNAGESGITALEFDAAARAAVAKLSPRLREVFELRVYQELTSQQVAEVLGISVASVHKQMYRATRELAAVLIEWADLV